MKYSSTLLKKFISVNDDAKNIANNLILKTVEIEWIESRNISDSVVIGFVKKCEKHLEADKLSVCIVDCGKKWEYKIICGGSNIKEWIFVPVALPWTFLDATKMKIEKRIMKWIESNGMICSKQELGINEDVELHTIRDLEKDFDDVTNKDLWMPFKIKYPRIESYALDVDSKWLTNRPDLTWHFGITTELNAIYGKNVSFNKIKDYVKQFQNMNIIQILDGSTKLDRKVVGQTDGLNSYILMEIKNININQTWFFSRLQMIDLWANPRSNRVDFSNLFMLISGQPVHFFDAEKIDGDVIVRNAKNWEKFVDLFETEHELKSTDIVIADKKKILALAGVVGWLDSWINEWTKNILVEIANFDPVVVRKTWTRLALRTDAELRFEKNINPIYSLYCLLLFLDELKYYGKDLWKFELWGLSYFVNEKTKKEINNPKQIEIDRNKMQEFIFGGKVKWFDKVAKWILEWLWFVVKWNNVTVPIWRSPADMNIVEDIYEEVGRIYGYDKIPSAPLLSEMKVVPYTDYVGLNRKLEEILVRNLNFDQTETYPRINEKLINNFSAKGKEDFYSLQNPTNPEFPYLRNSMVYWLFSHLVKNSKFFDEFKIFDIGKKWSKKHDQKSDWKKFADEFVWEKGELGMLIYKKDISKRNNDPILEAKEIVRVIAKEVWLTGKLEFKKTEHKSYHPKKQAEIMYEKERIGFLWSIHPLVLKDFKLPENAWIVYIALRMDQLIDALKKTWEHAYTYETLQDQIVYRDLCFVVDWNKDFGWVLDAVKNIPEIKSVEVFDVYAGQNLGEWKKSVAFKIKIAGDWNTTTEQINEVMNKAIKEWEKAGWKLRE